MRHCLFAFICSAMLSAAAPAAPPAGSEARPAKPAPASAPASSPAARPAAEDDKEDQAALALLAAARKSFVTVEIWYKKDISDAADSQDRDIRVQRIYEEFIARRCPEEFPALVLDDRGSLLMIDDAIEKRFIDRIVVRDAAGKTWPARRDRMLIGAPGVILTVEPQAARELTPLQFVQPEIKGPLTSLMQANLYRSDDQWHLRVSRLYAAVRYDDPRDDNVYFGYRSGAAGRFRIGGNSLPALLADAQGRPVGCALAPFLDLRQACCAWRSDDLCRGKAIPFAELDKLEADLEARLTLAACEIVLTLRQSSAAVDPTAGGAAMFGRSSGTAAGQEITLHGVAVSPTEVLVCSPLDRKLAAQIESIALKTPKGGRKPLEFVGAYKGFGAMMLRLAQGTLPVAVELAPDSERLGQMQPFWTAEIRKRFGKTGVQLTTNRLMGKVRTHGGRFCDSPASEIPPGSLLLDLKGRLVGLNLIQRVENEEEREFQSEGRFYQRPECRVFHLADVRAALAAPAGHLDARIQVKTRSESKRRAWLGVEFVPISPDLAEQLKVERPTKDGKLGFLVNAVYEGSPAQRLGVQVGDILLRLQADGMTYPIDLAPGRSYGEDDFGTRWGGQSEGEDGEGYLVPTWKVRSNFLTQALDAIGVGRKVKITCCRAETSQMRTIDYTIEQAPPDLESAPRWKNEKLGLTVKDMTYEVRYAMNLPRQAPGVVLAKVERGSPVLVAKVFPFEIITRLDDKPLTSSRQMRDLVAQAHKAGQKTVRLTVLRLGKTRFADVSIEAYAPADDEGLDEE